MKGGKTMRQEPVERRARGLRLTLSSIFGPGSEGHISNIKYYFLDFVLAHFRSKPSPVNSDSKPYKR